MCCKMLSAFLQSRRLLAYPYQRGYAQRRRELLQTGESEGGGSGEAAGCFPDIYTQQDFINWLDGSYIGTFCQPCACHFAC